MNDGHAAITRPVPVGSATATLAARLATLPTINKAHGSGPPRLPVQLDQHVHVQVGHGPGDQQECRRIR